MSDPLRTMPGHAPPRKTSRVPYLAALILFAIVLAGAGFLVAKASLTTDPASQSPSAQSPAAIVPSSTPASPVVTAAQKLLADSENPLACAVTFAGDNVATEPVLETQGVLYQSLPTPKLAGQVFAGWYTSSESALAYDQANRVNGSKQAECVNQEITLFGSWMSAEQNAQEDAEIPILMYHQFTTKIEGEDNWLRGNYMYIGDFEAHLAYIHDNDFYLPTWLELSDFIDGSLYLPSDSVILTDDDADPTWVELAAPLVEKYQVITTSFVIGIDGAGPELSQYVLKRSHTYDMHSAGDNGQGRMVNWTVEQIAADLEKSAEILGGAKEVVAYPYGQNNETAHEGLLQAGYIFGRTIDAGYVRIGTDKLSLPVVRMNYGMAVDALAAAIN